MGLNFVSHLKECRQRVFEHGIINKIIGSQRQGIQENGKNSTGRSFMICASPQVEEAEWVGHVMYMVKPEGKSQLVRARHRW